MAGKNIDKFLEQMREFVDREYQRGALDRFPTMVTMTSEGFAEGFKEGYKDILKKDPSLPVLTDAQFLEAGQKAVDKVRAWAQKPRTRGVLVEDDRTKIVYRASRDFKSPYTLAKKAGADEIQRILKRQGSRQLGGRDKEKGISARGSELGILKSATHRAHQGVTTVGAAQVSAALRFLDQTRSFAGFAASEEASEIAHLLQNINATFNTTGTKSGTKPTEVSLNEGITVGLEMLPRSKNPAGVEDYDLNKLLPKVEKAVRKYVEKQNIQNLPGSKSIEENAVDVTTYMVLKTLSKSKHAKVVTPLKKPKGRKKRKLNDSKNYKGIQTKVSTKKAKALKARKKVAKSSASQPLTMIALLNKELPRTVRKNMKLPGLVNRTGSFADSVKVTDISATPKGFPSVGYTYQKNPYEVFEMGNGDERWATPERDPRFVIDRSIREIAVQFAMGRFYTRRL